MPPRISPYCRMDTKAYSPANGTKEAQPPIDDTHTTGDDIPWLKLAVPLDLLEKLLREQRLCAADVRCLDNTSKHHLARLCLKSCATCLAAPPATVDDDHRT